MVVLCCIIAEFYESRDFLSAEQGDITYQTLFTAYSDVGTWENWDSRSMSGMRDML